MTPIETRIPGKEGSREIHITTLPGNRETLPLMGWIVEGSRADNGGRIIAGGTIIPIREDEELKILSESGSTVLEAVHKKQREECTFKQISKRVQGATRSEYVLKDGVRVDRRVFVIFLGKDEREEKGLIIGIMPCNGQNGGQVRRELITEGASYEYSTPEANWSFSIRAFHSRKANKRVFCIKSPEGQVEKLKDLGIKLKR